MVAGSLLQASVGFGIALFVVPLLVLLNPVFVPGPMLFASLFLAAIMAFRGWSAIDLKKLGLAGVGLFVGTAAGALALMIVAADKWPKLFAVFILVAVALSASGIHIPATRRNLVAAGIISGVMGTISGIHGPPMALLYQREPGNIVRATLAIFFVMAYAIALIALGTIGLFGKKELLLGLTLAPGVIAGYIFARFSTKLLDRGYWLRLAILTVASLSAIALLLRR
ncbi:MAG: TSUP family transporter [Deltaproteobacteria bacterium]|nr:TSUP family transporter [Deltaproteobacteria bacterium]